MEKARETQAACFLPALQAVTTEGLCLWGSEILAELEF